MKSIWKKITIPLSTVAITAKIAASFEPAEHTVSSSRQPSPSFRTQPHRSTRPHHQTAPDSSRGASEVHSNDIYRETKQFSCLQKDRMSEVTNNARKIRRIMLPLTSCKDHSGTSNHSVPDSCTRHFYPQFYHTNRHKFQHEALLAAASS
jgi:hypothetical protein